MTPSDVAHRPVFVAELLAFLVRKGFTRYCDCTCGHGHFTERLAQAAAGDARLLAIDIDPAAVAATRVRLAHFGERCIVAEGSYVDLGPLAAGAGLESLDAVVIDAGLVSREQLLDPEKGLSFMVDGNLSMKIRPDEPGPTAASLVNTLPPRELARLFRGAGESPRTARAMARAIADARARTPIARTVELARVIEEAVDRARLRRGTSHPATRAFLALRNTVSRELAVLEQGIQEAVGCLDPGGRLCVITYFGTEHALVRRTLRRLERGCICPPDLPICACGKQPALGRVVREALSPSPREIAANESARSARLHVVERTAAPL